MTKRYVLPAETVEVLNGVNLVVEPGELTCIYGESGSGKSTLLNIAATVGEPDSGEVWFGDECVSSLSEADRARFRLNSVGIVFQDGNLIPDFTASENVEVILRARGMSRQATRSDAADALTSLGIGELSQRYPRELSGGQQQRVGIARALAGGKKVIIADEPTGALDRKNSQKLFNLLAELTRELQVAIVIGTHDSTAASYTNSAFGLVDGTLHIRTEA